jgi:hypothetical protein
MTFVVLMLALIPLTTVGMLVDDHVLMGSPIWFKPFKFAVSFALYGTTLAWMLTKLTRGRRTGWWAGTVIAVAGIVEMLIIVGQVVRGTRSHFNVTTPFDATLFSIMGLTIVVLWSFTALIAVLVALSRFDDLATGWAIRLGLLLALIGLGLGFLMLLPTPDQASGVVKGVVGSHSAGIAEGGPSMALTGWSTTGGDLRVPHFVGMHALQLLPLIAVALGFVVRDTRTRLRLVLVTAAGYASVIALTTWQALRGQSLVHPDALTLGALAVLGVGVAVAALVSTRSATVAA